MSVAFLALNIPHLPYVDSADKKTLKEIQERAADAAGMGNPNAYPLVKRIMAA